MLDYKVKIGLIPIRRDCTPRPGIFNWEYAEARAKVQTDYIKEHFTDENVSFVDLEGINDVAVLYNEKDVEAVVNRMRAEKVAGVMIINSNFGNEEVAAMVTEELRLPVLLWGPLDDVFEPDGSRHTDSQCGLFAVSRNLKRYHVPFSYIQNCRVQDEMFAEGMKKFISVACMVKNFRGMRVGQVGLRPKPFRSVIFNEGELIERFGMHIIPVNNAMIIDKYNKIIAEDSPALEEGAKLLQSRYDFKEGQGDLEWCKKMYAFVLMYQQIFEEYDLDAISAECWTSMQLGVGAMPCTAYSVLADMGYIVGCEADMYGTITMALLSCASLGKKVPFMGEFTVRHPEDRNIELLWHCGPFAYSLKKPGCKCINADMRQWFEVKGGTYTVARMDQDNGKYQIVTGLCEGASGPYNFGTHLWAKFDDLDAWEDKLINGPYIHHVVEIEGDYREEIKEFCKFVPNLELDPVE